MIFDEFMVFNKSLNLYGHNDIMNTCNSENKFCIQNDTNNIIIDTKDNFSKLQQPLDNNTQKKINEQVQQIAEETDIEYNRPKRIVKNQNI